MDGYRVRVGTHADLKTGKKYSKGDVVLSARPLDKLFREKFDKVDVEIVKVKVEVPVNEEGKVVETEETIKEKEPVVSSETEASPFGEDVTNAFEEAEKNGFKVFKKGNWHTVTNSDDTKKSLNGDKGLRASAVGKFIVSFLEKE